MFSSLTLFMLTLVSTMCVLQYRKSALLGQGGPKQNVNQLKKTTMRTTAGKLLKVKPTKSIKLTQPLKSTITS